MRRIFEAYFSVLRAADAVLHILVCQYSSPSISARVFLGQTPQPNFAMKHNRLQGSVSGILPPNLFDVEKLEKPGQVKFNNYVISVKTLV